MPLDPLDHALAVGLGACYPVAAYLLYERRRPALRAGVPGARLREYRDTILCLAGMGVVTLVVWCLAGRPWAGLGLGQPAIDRATVVASLAVLAVAGLFGYQLRRIRADPRAGVMGVAFSGLYAWTGTLWLPMLLHVLIDAFAGQAALATRRSGTPIGGEPPA